MQEPTEQYLIFCGDYDQSFGGWENYQSHFPDLTTLFDALPLGIGGCDWAHIVNLSTRKIIYEMKKGEWVKV
jgi:hypothetical protein